MSIFSRFKGTSERAIKVSCIVTVAKKTRIDIRAWIETYCHE